MSHISGSHISGSRPAGSHVARSHIALHVLRRRRVAYAQGLIHGGPGGIVAAAGDLAAKDVLVLGPVVGSTMCALVMTECRRAESRLPGCRVDPGAADIVLVPAAPGAAMPGLVRQAAAALRDGGSVVIQLPGRPAAAAGIRDLVSAGGFLALREVGRGDARFLLAERRHVHAAE